MRLKLEGALTGSGLGGHKKRFGAYCMGTLRGSCYTHSKVHTAFQARSKYNLSHQ